VEKVPYKFTKRQKKQLRLPSASAGFQNIVWYTNQCRNQDCVHCTVKGFTSQDVKIFVDILPPPKL
jgi:hypothetical protein